jgi:hypothetical protein
LEVLVRVSSAVLSAQPAEAAATLAHYGVAAIALLHGEEAEGTGLQTGLATYRKGEERGKRKGEGTGEEHREQGALQSSSSSAEQLNAMNARVPGLKYQEMERLMKEGRCFYCREQGHMKQACPKRKAEMQKKSLN